MSRSFDDEGRIPFRGFETWFGISGAKEDEGKLPLLTLHGGPGACHDYLEPLEDLADTGRRVIFYDQLGCGSSGIADRPHDPAMWTVELFVDEVGAVREALGLERVHILGQSWGGMLAMEYALTQPNGVASLIIESSPASIPQWFLRRTGSATSCLPMSSRRCCATRRPGRPTAPSTKKQWRPSTSGTCVA